MGRQGNTHTHTPGGPSCLCHVCKRRRLDGSAAPPCTRLRPPRRTRNGLVFVRSHCRATAHLLRYPIHTETWRSGASTCTSSSTCAASRPSWTKTQPSRCGRGGAGHLRGNASEEQSAHMQEHAGGPAFSPGTIGRATAPPWRVLTTAHACLLPVHPPPPLAGPARHHQPQGVGRGLPLAPRRHDPHLRQRCPGAGGAGE